MVVVADGEAEMLLWGCDLRGGGRSGKCKYECEDERAEIHCRLRDCACECRQVAITNRMSCLGSTGVQTATDARGGRRPCLPCIQLPGWQARRPAATRQTRGTAPEVCRFTFSRTACKSWLLRSAANNWGSPRGHVAALTCANISCPVFLQPQGCAFGQRSHPAPGTAAARPPRAHDIF